LSRKFMGSGFHPLSVPMLRKVTLDGELFATKFTPRSVYEIEFSSATDSVSFDIVVSGQKLPQTEKLSSATFSLISPPQAPYTEPIAVQSRPNQQQWYTKYFEGLLYSVAFNEEEAEFFFRQSQKSMLRRRR